MKKHSHFAKCMRVVMILMLMLVSQGITSLTTVVTASEPEIVPGGPWLTTEQTVSLRSMKTYDELVKTLIRIEMSSKGLVTLEVIGLSNQGRDIYLAKIGDPDNRPVMIITQQHGYEPVNTESALELIKFLSKGSVPAMEILDSLYVLIVPRVNPDGAEKYWQYQESRDSTIWNESRYNVDHTAPAANADEGFFTDWDAGVGWDVNRYHWVTDWTESTLYANHPGEYPENPVPEAVAIINTFNRYLPEWIADFHHQGTYVTEDGENVSSSVLWPTNENVSESVINLSKQLCITIHDHMAQYGYATVTQFHKYAYPATAENGYALAGAASILVEVKNSVGQKQIGMIKKHAVQQMWSILRATADESLYSVDSSRSDEIPAVGTYYPRILPH
jgi:hypothetical protein